jgi:hypothetical protein
MKPHMGDAAMPSALALPSMLNGTKENAIPLFDQATAKRATPHAEFCVIELDLEGRRACRQVPATFGSCCVNDDTGSDGSDGSGGNPPGCPGWWAFLDTYRTLCLAPDSKIREIFEELRSGDYAKSIE